MDTLEKLEEKINKAVALIDKLNQENGHLIDENKRLKTQLTETESRITRMEKEENEKSETVKRRLSSILDRLGNLEQL
nr:cell division protein ZapB [candidate division Zixibacteria bacterium]